MATEPRNPEREARDRVSLRQDRDTRALTELQRAERERDAERQNRAVENSLANQAKLEADKKIALAEHDKLWKQASDRLTPRPIPAPAFDMMGGPPARNLVQDHDEMRQRSTERRDQIVKDFDQRIVSTEATRAQIVQGFSRANEARDQAHGEARRDLAQSQEQSFERLVKKELDRADKWTSREFKQRSRDGDARDL
jgi:hypothetical protein